MGGVYRVLMGKPEGKRPLRKPRHRMEDNIKGIFRKWYVGVWTGLSNRWQTRVNVVMNLWVT
jgi:hypothetical protein